MFLYKFIILCVAVLRSTQGKVTDMEYLSMPSLFHLDDFDKCMVSEKTSLYCIITVQLSPINPNNHSAVWKVISDVISHEKNYRHDHLRHGICVGESCPQLRNNISSYKNNSELLKNAISECYSEKYQNLGLQGFVTDLHCETSKPFYSVDIYDISVGIFLIVLFVIVMFASLYERYTRDNIKQNNKNVTLSNIILCFALLKNWKRLGSKDSSPDANYFRCINGIRFYNIIVIITMHVCLGFIIAPIANPQFYENLADEPFNTPFLTAIPYIVQTFFVIAGLLLSYNFFLIFQGHKKVKFSYILIAFINRYIRLIPCLMVVAAINGTWLYHLGRGPFWDKVVGVEYRNCRENWWTNLLFINNFYNTERMCMQHSWYVAADIHLYLISLLIITFMWKYQKHTKIILSISLIVGIFLPGITNYIYDYDIVIRMYPELVYNMFIDLQQFHVIYSSSYTNIGGYVIGLFVGYVFYTCREKKVFTKTRHVVIWWILAWGLPLSMAFVGIPIYSENYKHSRFLAAIYVSLARNVFALGIAIGVFGISQGVGWFLRDAVIWSPLQVLGRLTYCVYLVHMMLLRVGRGLVRTPSYITFFSLLTHLLETVIISYIFALLLHLFVEMPFSALQRLLIPQLEGKRNRVLQQTTASIFEAQPTNNIDNNHDSKL